MDEQRIHILDKSVSARIAAGEVVERPASVVKELIENSIDAAAGAISVEMRAGGVGLLRVIDNGRGMSSRDAALAVERFATSKIRTEADLNAIKTLGFRGEALPSIANVARLEITTRARDAVAGTRVRVVDGRAEAGVTGAPIGTQVTVRDLFYNAPARRKFLKAPLREAELIQKTVVKYALAYPQIAFRLIVDGRESLVWPAIAQAPREAAQERIGAVWGRDVAGEMLPIDHTSVDLRVRGFVSGPTLARASRDWQYFYVNGRPIRSGLLAVMLERPYAGRLPPNRHPLAVIHIELDPALVDMNVHPRKAEVRFYQERSVYGAVAQAVAAGLSDFPLIVSSDSTDWSFANAPLEDSGWLRSSGPLAAAERPEHWRAIGQIHLTYILVQSREGMVIVDQHAAQEQIFYERLTSPDRAQAPHTPVHALVELLPKEAGLLKSYWDEYRALGLDLEPFGENTLRVRALPAFIRLSPAQLIAALLQEHERYPALVGDALRDKLAAKAACVAAIKAGDALNPDEQQALLDDLMRADAPATCPHGRPVFVTLRLEELGQRFLRR